MPSILGLSPKEMQMKKIPIRSGGEAIICKDVRAFIPGQVCFLNGEWEYTKRLAAAIHDTEERKAFFETLLQKKRDSSTYLVTDDFPLDLRTEPKMPDNFMVDYVGNIIDKLKKEGSIK